jgi:hypothetical protein
LTLKGPSKRVSGAKQRYEAEVEIELLPPAIGDMSSLLRNLGLLTELERLAECASPLELVPIGAIRNRRSAHRYEHGLHRLELTWDELEFPTGPSQIRLEVEARSDMTDHLLDQAASELRAVFGERLEPPKRGKIRELCERLYPDLLAA